MWYEDWTTTDGHIWLYRAYGQVEKGGLSSIIIILYLCTLCIMRFIQKLRKTQNRIWTTDLNPLREFYLIRKYIKLKTSLLYRPNNPLNLWNNSTASDYKMVQLKNCPLLTWRNCLNGHIIIPTKSTILPYRNSIDIYFHQSNLTNLTEGASPHTPIHILGLKRLTSNI
jgi:hypothetical protein